MIKLFALLVPRDGMSPLHFHDHWRYAHGPLAGRIRRAHSYVQCHRLPLQPADLPVLPHGGTAEVAFADLETANGLMTDPDYTEHAAHDEDNFHHMDRMTALQATEHVVLAGPPQRKDSGGVKVMQFVGRAAGTSPEDFRAAWSAPHPGEAERLATLRVERASRWAQVPESYAGGDVTFDGVRELWWPDQWAFEAARAREPEVWDALVGGPGIAPSAGGFLVTSVHRVTWPAED
jgi:hypothetical protein